MSSVAGVVEALRKTPKGRLKYGCEFDSSSPEETLRLLNEWSSPPPLSPEITNYLKEREKFQNEVKRTNSATPVIKGDNDEPTEDPNVTVTTTYVVEDTSYSTYKLDVSDDEDVTMATTYVAEPHFESVVNEMEREQLEWEQSLDDKLMEESQERLVAQRQWFQREMERVRERNQFEYEQEKAKRERLAQAVRDRQLEEERRMMLDSQKQMEELTFAYKLRDELLEANLRSGEEQKMLIQKKIEEGRKMKRLKLLQQCRELKIEVDEMIKQVVAIFQNCSYPQFLPTTVGEDYERMHVTLREVLSGAGALEASGNPDEKSYEMLAGKLSNVLSDLFKISTAVKDANERGDREKREREEQLREKLERERKAQEEEEKKKKELATKLAQQTQQQVVVDKKVSTDGTGGVSTQKQTDLKMASSTLESYDRLQDLLSKTISSCAEFSSTKDLRVKKYRFDLQKIINITMNSISASSGEDLLEKIVRLKKLFGGERVTVTGGTTLSINDHPEAKLYCFNLFAGKLVKHGEDQVASNSEAAFPIAAVAIGLWSLFPDLGDLILAHFYSVCPILVPMFVEQKDGALSPDLLKLQGFRVSSGGAVESEDVFLKRMRGVVRLYAAIVQTPQLPLGGQPRPPHPHSVECGWAWMARILNMEPHPTLTANALGDFLEVAGHAMMQRFGRQFRKLLLVLCKEYIPKIEKVTPPAQKGPLSRLTLLLEDCISAGKIREPKGTLNESFWRSRSHGVMIA